MKGEAWCWDYVSEFYLSEFLGPGGASSYYNQWSFMLELLYSNGILGRKLYQVKIQKQQSEAETVSPCRVHGQVVAGLHWSVQESDPVVCSLHSGGLHCFYHACKGLLYLTLFFSFLSMTLNKDWSEQDFVLGVIVGKAQSIHMKHWTLLLDKSYLSLYLSYDWPIHALVFFPGRHVVKCQIIIFCPIFNLPTRVCYCVCNHEFMILIDNSQKVPILYLFLLKLRRNGKFVQLEERQALEITNCGDIFALEWNTL